MSRVLPILFNTEMVRAILDGRKAVTRRAIKHNVDAVLDSPYHREHSEVSDKMIIEKLCKPPYQPEDILYVRETWSYEQDNECIGVTGGECSNKSCEEADSPCFKCHYIYKASDNLPVGKKWRPSIHMPKEAARIWLKVTDVRVERLQDISGGEVLKEGIKKSLLFDGNVKNAFDKFSYLWNSTLKKSDLDRYGWDANPWVWVIEFERCGKPEEL